MEQFQKENQNSFASNWAMFQNSAQVKTVFCIKMIHVSTQLRFKQCTVHKSQVHQMANVSKHDYLYI